MIYRTPNHSASFKYSTCQSPHTRRNWLMMFAVVACLIIVSLVSAQAREIRIGVVQDQSSINSDLARDYMAGAQTYFDFINSQGGINGQKISVVAYNDNGDPQQTLQATRELINRDRVIALFGYVGDAAVTAVTKDPQFQKAGIALYAPLSGLSQTKVDDNIFFVRPTYRAETERMVNHFQSIGTRRYLIVHSEDSAGTVLAKEVSDVLTRSAASAIYQQPIPQTDESAKVLAARVAASGARVIVVAADTIGMAEFVRQYRKYDLGTSIVGFSTVNPRTLIELATPEFAGGTILTQVVPNPLLPETNVQNEHLRLFERFREEPPSHVTLEGFIAAKGLVAVLRRATSITRTGVLSALRGTQRYDVGGVVLNFTPVDDRGSKYVDIAFLRRTGKVIH